MPIVTKLLAQYSQDRIACCAPRVEEQVRLAFARKDAPPPEPASDAAPSCAKPDAEEIRRAA